MDLGNQYLEATVGSEFELDEQPKVAEQATTEKVEQPAAEVKTEEVKTEVKTETKVEAPAKEEKKPEEKGSFFEQFTKAEKVEVKPTEVVIPDEFKQELDSVKQKLERYKSSPIAKLLGGDYDLSKIELKDFLKQAVGADYSGLSDEALIEKSLQSNPNWDRLSPEEQSEEIESQKSKLEGMSRLEKLDYREGLLSKLNSQSDANEVFKTLQEIQEGQRNSIGNPEEWYNNRVVNDLTERFNTAMQSITETATSLVGQEYKIGDVSYKVTSEDAASMSSVFEKEFTQFNEQEKAFNLFKIATYESAVKAAYEQGKQEAVKKNANPSQGFGGDPSLKEGSPFGGGDRIAAFQEIK